MRVCRFSLTTDGRVTLELDGGDLSLTQELFILAATGQPREAICRAELAGGPPAGHLALVSLGPASAPARVRVNIELSGADGTRRFARELERAELLGGGAFEFVP